MSDVNFVTDGTLDRILDRSACQRIHHVETVRECFRRKIDHIDKDTLALTKHCHDLLKCNADVSDELKELDVIVSGLTLTVALLHREANRNTE